MKNLITLSLGLATAASAFALTDGPYFGFYPGAESYASLNFTGATITVPGFTVSGGILDSVSFIWAGSLGTIHGAVNNGGTTEIINLTTTANLTLRRPDNTSLVVTTPTVSSEFTLASNTSETKDEAFGSDSDSNTVSTGLTPFLASTITFNVTGTASNGSDGGGSIVTSFTSRANGAVTVNYNYHTAGVPEPKVYGALGAVACLGLLGYRRYRNQQA